MIQQKIFSVDTETGGFNPEKDAILSIALIDIDTKASFTYLTYNETLSISLDALKVNKIDISQHKKQALSELDVVKGMIRVFEANTISGQKPMLFGQNINFDIGFLKELFKRTGHNLYKYIHYKHLDLQSINWFLQYSGVVETLPFKLEKLIEKFKIPVKAHTADGDAFANIVVLDIFKEVVKK